MFEAMSYHRATAAFLLAMIPASALSQSGGNQWNPYAAPQALTQAAPFAPPKYIGDAPIPLAPVEQQPAAPSKFAPPGLDQSLDSNAYSQAPAPTISPQPQFTGPQQNFGPGPNSFSSGPGFNPGYGPQFPGNGYPQAFGGYPPAYSAPQGYGYPGFQGYPGNGAYPQNSPFGFPGNSGNFPGNFSNGGMSGFGFSPFGFF